MQDERKTKAQLIEELTGLREEVSALKTSRPAAARLSPGAEAPPVVDYRRLFEALPLPATVIDAGGVIADVNEAFLEWSGRHGNPMVKSDCVGDHIASEAQAKTRRARMAGFVEELLGQEETRQVRWESALPDGTRLWWSIRGVPLRDEAGAGSGAVILREEITQQVQAETALQESEAAVRTKLQAILEPAGDLGTLELDDIIDREALQAMMEDFFRLTKLGSAVVDLTGKVLVATGWQEICTRFHRVHPETRANCEKSDTVLSAGVAPGTFGAYHCRNHLWDLATPIRVGGKHLGNVFLGQFFYEDEIPDYDVFRDQARQYGFDERQYLAALDRVPRWNRETVDAAMAFYADLAGMISTLSYGRIALSRALADQGRLLGELRQSEERYQVFMDHASDQVFLKDADHRYLLANRATEAFMGRPGPEIVGRTDLDLMPEATAERCHRSDREALQRARATVSEEEVRDRVYEVRKFPVPLRDDQVGIGGFVRDITERKQAEREAAGSLAVQRVRNEILEMRSAADWSRVLGVLHRELSALMSFHEIGYAVVHGENGAYEGHIVSADGTLRSSVHPSVPEAVQRAIGTQAPVFRRTRADMVALGEPLPLPARSVVDVPFREGTFSANHTVEDAFGEAEVQLGTQFAPVLWEGQARLGDLVERQRAEEARRHSEEQYRLVVDHANEAIVVAQDGVLKFCNPKTSELTGHSREGLTALPFLDLVHPDDRALVLERHRRRLKGEELTKVYPFRVLDRQGHTRWVEINAVGITWEGRPATLNFLSDIAERKRLEGDLVRVERQRVAGELAAGVAHNLNNILTAVLGPAQLLQRRCADPEVLREVEVIVTASHRAVDLIRRLSQAVRSGPEGALGAVSLNGQVRAVVEMARPRWKDEPEARGVAIEVATRLGTVPAIQGRADELGDAIFNLVLNAVEAMPEGGTLTITTELAAHGVQLRVADTGIGMDPETCRRVFEPFFTTKRDVGSGLGLATVRGVVQRWGGTIAVESAPGQGATFTLCFPVAAEPAPPVAAAAAPEAPGRAGRILVVEDDEGVSAVLRQLLSRQHTVQEVGDGHEALAGWAPGQFDVVLIDLGLPEMAGDQVAAALRQVDPALATVLITGWVLEPDDARSAGFDFVLPKPFASLREVESVVAQAIELHDARK